jgi:hypothetical protein
MTNLIKLLLGVLVLISAVLFFAWKNRQRMKPYYDRLEALSKDISGSISKSQRFFNDAPRLIGDFYGHKFLLTYCHSEGAPPTFLQLRCYINSVNKLKIFAYSKPSTVLFAKRVHISDDIFDNYYIYSNKPNEARQYLSNESRKAIIRQIIEKGWSFPHITKNYISIYANVDHSLDPAALRLTLAWLIELKT